MDRLDEDPEVLHDIRALVVPDKKQIWVNNTLDRKRWRFSVLHEIAHFVLPGHAAEFDLRQHTLPIGSATISELTTDALIKKEQEANEFAAACLFQVERFDRMIEEMPFGWTSILKLAKRFDASFEATARRYVERQVHHCALIIFKPVAAFGPLERHRPSLSLEYTITSPGFEDLYFSSLRSDQTIDAGNPAFDLFYTSYGDETLDVTLNVHNASTGEMNSFDASFFSNRYKLMALLRPLTASPDASR